MSAVIDFKESLRVFYELAAEGRPPSIREYQERIGLSSSSSTSYRLDRLIELGWLHHIGRTGESRTLVVTERGKQVLGICEEVSV